MSRILGVQLGGSLESIVRFWLSNKRNGVVNITRSVSASVWCLWKLGNDLCFEITPWRCMAILLYRISMTIQTWAILCPLEKKEALLETMGLLKKEAAQVPWLEWR